MQEAYCLLRSKYTGGGGTPFPGPGGGTPSQVQVGDTPFPCPGGGNPFPGPGGGIPLPRSRLGRYPIPSRPRKGILSPQLDLGKGYSPCPDLGRGYPPPMQTWEVGTPHTDLGRGTPSSADGGTPSRGGD